MKKPVQNLFVLLVLGQLLYTAYTIYECNLMLKMNAQLIASNEQLIDLKPEEIDWEGFVEAEKMMSGGLNGFCMHMKAWTFTAGVVPLILLIAYLRLNKKAAKITHSIADSARSE